MLLSKLEKCARYCILSVWQWLITVHHYSNSFYWKMSQVYLQKNLAVKSINVREKVGYVKWSHLNMYLIIVQDVWNTASCGLHLFLGKHYTNVPLAAEITKLLLTWHRVFHISSSLSHAYYRTATISFLLLWPDCSHMV